MIKVDASNAARLAFVMAKAHDELVGNIQSLMRTQGPVIRDEVRALAPVTSKVPGYSRSIGSRVNKNQDGATITVESRSPFGYILEFGAGHSGPHPHFGPVFEPAAARLEPLLIALVDKAI